MALAWRLALACRDSYTGNYDTLFYAWYRERKQQLDKSLRATVTNGAYCTESNPYKIFVRDWHLWFVQLFAAGRRKLEMGPRALGMTVYWWEEAAGMPFLPELGGGRNVPQVYCRQMQATQVGNGITEMHKVMFTDDVIYDERKRGVFQVVVLLEKIEHLEEAMGDINDVDRLSQGEACAKEATFIVQDVKATLASDTLHASTVDVFRLATGDEFALEDICRNRPAPRYYDEFRMKRDLRGAKYVLVRPDRFVFAACHTKDELEKAAKALPRAMGL